MLGLSANNIEEVPMESPVLSDQELSRYTAIKQPYEIPYAKEKNKRKRDAFYTLSIDAIHINSLDISNTTKDHIKRLFNNCVDKAITTISIYDLKQYCINNKLQYQSMYVLFRRIFGTNFIEKLNDLYKKYTNL